MAYEMKPGQGSAFKNENKTEDWHPAYKGKVMLPSGDIHWLDITPKKTKAGETYVAVKVGRLVTGGGGAVPPVGGHSVAKGNGFQPQPADDTDIPF